MLQTIRVLAAALFVIAVAATVLFAFAKPTPAGAASPGPAATGTLNRFHRPTELKPAFSIPPNANSGANDITCAGSDPCGP